MKDQNAGRRDRPSIDARTQAKLGEKLRSHFNDLVNQPIPQHLIDLLGRLEAGTKAADAARQEPEAGPQGAGGDPKTGQSEGNPGA